MRRYKSRRFCLSRKRNIITDYKVGRISLNFIEKDLGISREDLQVMIATYEVGGSQALRSTRPKRFFVDSNNRLHLKSNNFNTGLL